VQKSFVLPATFPCSKTSVEGLQDALDTIREFDIDVIEYYCESRNSDKISGLLGGLESVFLTAALQKQQNLRPCSPDASERKKAVELMTESMRFAEQAGARSVLINSGRRPDDEKKDDDCHKYLMESLCALHNSVKNIGILVEPGDRDIEYRHLIGHTKSAVMFIQEIRKYIQNISLVFDMSHIAQLSEDLYDSWDVAKDYCPHVHLANCSLVEGSEFYGDKHPPFGIKDGVYSHSAALEFYKFLCDTNTSLTIGLEIICHTGSAKDFFWSYAKETDWFLKKRK